MSRKEELDAYVRQIKHNEDFLSFIEARATDDFVDWKITVVFYIAVHLVHALAAHQRKAIGHQHSTVNNNLNPKNTTSTMPVPQKVYNAYIDLYQTSRTVRYSGIWSDVPLYMKLRTVDYQRALENLSVVKKYVQGKGVVLY